MSLLVYSLVNANVPERDAGLATARTDGLLADGAPVPDALTSGFARALLLCGVFIAAAALVALWTANSRGEARDAAEPEAAPPSVPAVREPL